MAVQRARVDCGVGEIEDQVIERNCHICGGPWDVPEPVRSAGNHPRYGKQKYLPHPAGNGLCWECWDNRGNAA